MPGTRSVGIPVVTKVNAVAQVCVRAVQEAAGVSAAEPQVLVIAAVGTDLHASCDGQTFVAGECADAHVAQWIDGNAIDAAGGQPQRVTAEGADTPNR